MSFFSSKWHKCSGIDRVSSVGLFDYIHGTMSEIGDIGTLHIHRMDLVTEGFISCSGDYIKNKYSHISLIGREDCSYIGGWWVGKI